MATRLLCRSNKDIITRWKHFLRLSNYTRNFASEAATDGDHKTENVTIEPEAVHRWLDAKAGIFGPSDQRMPLPGDIGFGKELKTILPQDLPELELQLSSEFSDPALQNNFLLSPPEDLMVDFEKVGKSSNQLQCKIQTCPDLLKKDFQSLFPGRRLERQNLTVVTVCQKTEGDMSAWSENIEAEREELIANFVDSASDICDFLRNQGYWADFIDPTSGRPYLGNFTNATLFETDERFRHFGFVIDDLGCCKVISHRKWGPKIFVGAIFTEAPVNSDVIQFSLSKL